MTTTQPTTPTTRRPNRPPIAPPSLAQASATVVWRNLIHIKRMPEMLLDVTVQSVMFVLLFAFVFGGSIAVAGSNYREFLLPGIMVQTMVFSSAIVAMGLTNDLQKGIVDRLKSLPISRASVLVGRSISSLIHSSIGVTVMAVTGLLIGWRIRTGVLEAALGFFLLLLFGFAMIWLGIWVGSLMRTVEAVQGFMFTVMFPLTFVANTFAPTENMPSWLRFIAEWNPVSALTQACRQLWGNGPAAPPDAAWPLQNPVVVTIAWSLLFTAVFAPLALAAFRRRSRD
ncbi:ABC transporter permease [Nocardioides jiangsuensis]|nr:ABC transporter permease [Nocardioides jiangsuensis]